MLNLRISLLLFIAFPLLPSWGAKAPPPLEESQREPIKYIGEEQTDKRFYDGGLRHAVGVHSYQVFRANRKNPSEGGVVGWTYNHQPFICYWNGTYFVHYLSNVVQEHDPPGRTLLVTSKDGRNWENPRVLFPEYKLPEIEREGVYIPAGTLSVMHQRMGFYVAPNDRLLALGFYSYCEHPRTSPNAGQGLGRVVREIYKDGSFGPIHFIRYNRHAGFNESNTNYPFYKTSGDSGFLEACEALLADKLVTLQWWEEDRAKDGFYTIDPGDIEGAFKFDYNMTTSQGPGKALCYFHRPDGVVCGIWKNQWTALSSDEGLTWTPITLSRTLNTCGAKVWVQRTEDDRYALVYNHSATLSNRFPMAVMTGDDGHEFDNLLTLHGEVPEQRYQGIHRSQGPQYIRGIVEGNGDPPGKHMWNVYSVNKEDIWASRTHVPITGVVEEDVDENFDDLASEGDLEQWNLYNPKWARIRVIEKGAGKCLELFDEEPNDHAVVERMFPESSKFNISFRVNPADVPVGRCVEIEVQDKKGDRPMRLRFDKDRLYLDRWQTRIDPIDIEQDRWYSIEMAFDCANKKYDLALDGEWIRKDVPFTEVAETQTLERLVIRTGPYRNDVRAYVVDGKPSPIGIYTEDLSGSEEKHTPIRFLVDDVKTMTK